MNDQQHAQLISDLQSSFYLFIRTFYPLLTARDFITPSPAGRESHIITIARELVKCAKLETNRLIITVPPGHGKSTLLSFWVAWCLAKYPDSRFIYISYAHTLAAKHTDVVRRIMMMKEYKDLFGVELRTDSKAKDYFQTTAGGAVAAFGSSGAVTGVDAGYPGLDRFSGAVIIDDPIKPNDAFSDVIREGIEQNYKDTIQQRARGPNVPFIFIGQRVHEADLGAYLLNGEDGYEWKKVVLKSLDEAGNALYPEAWPLDKLKILQQFHPYEFAAQHQQNPQPAGGSVFKEEWFVRLDFDPNITITFITADTAETDKSWNDATVFSFWGVYEIESMGRSTGEYGLHWIDCQELRIEPKDLKEAFLDFYGDCMRYKIPPLMAAIEKKSTGVTLTSVLSELRGLQVRSIERSRASGSKTSRFLAAQPYVASKRISFTDGARHVDMCINHMGRITTNDSHKNDDVCFVAGTKISTKHGYKNIENIQVDDYVITPFGYGRVIACGSVGIKSVIKRINLIGTENHPVFVNNSFVRLDTITDDDTISKLTFTGLLKWKYQKLLNSMQSSIDSWGRESIILASQQSRANEKVLKDCMSRFGNFIREGQLMKAFSFITKTITLLITTLKILSVFHAHNTLKIIKKIEINGIIATNAKSIFKKFKKKLNNGMRVLRELIGIEKTQKLVLINYGTLHAGFATNHSQQELNQPFIAHMNAIKLNTLNEHEKSVLEKEVFNLTVEHYGVYYANDILVSNCDTLADAVRIALIDKTLLHANSAKTDYNALAQTSTQLYNKVDKLRQAAYRQ